MAEVKQHPLMCTFRDAISGDGFLGGVTVAGRALMGQDNEGKWWMVGARASALGARGGAPRDTVLRVRARSAPVVRDPPLWCCPAARGRQGRPTPRTQRGRSRGTRSPGRPTPAALPVGHIRNATRFLDIRDCANKHISRL